ncbi:CocE/NonD family hydrolase [Undibacterium sp. 5I1]|uniref:CocE/NonD family hydrolase n=3 Tax=Undibacterium TaxID=401469 RepID=UPI002AB44340|nr:MULTISPECIES: CocE/NonD family hydrolase [unclassified Undibacterium]MDY7539866.1 CocE/NonD family hydrolase [Undibacterium sp. 5I1]MEB0232456.1 CocE/NonD family hydrolase [Undibacterium sp. 10I3]
MSKLPLVSLLMRRAVIGAVVTIGTAHISSYATTANLSSYASNTNEQAPGDADNRADNKAEQTKAEQLKQRSDYIRKNYSKFEYRIPMRDGKHLFTAVYIPNDASSKRYPMLMQRTPYSVAPYGSENYKKALGSTAEYEKEGFIFVFQDVRGSTMSEGDYVNMRPQIENKTKTDFDESTDTYDSIDWLIKHIPNNNGKVGQWGISYPGFYTSAGAIDSHPALKAVSPQAPIADWFRGDDMHRNGAFNLQMAFGFFSGFGKPRPVPTDLNKSRPFSYGTPDGYQFFIDLGALSNANPKYFKNEIPYWNEIIQHPNYDAYWQSRNLLPHLKNIKAAVLTVGGWYDTEDLYGPLQTYKAIEKQNPGISNSIVIGPWTHGGWTRGDGDKIGDANFGFKTALSYQPVEFAFFKYHLKGGDKPNLSEAWMFETGANRWRSFDAWPPKNTESKSLYFQANGKLSFKAPADEAMSASSSTSTSNASTSTNTKFDEYVSDPAKPVPYTTEISTNWSNQYVAADQRFASRRPDVVTYQTDVLERDVTIAGPLTADLFVSTTGTDADFVVKLIDVNPAEMPTTEGDINRGGQQTLVRGEPFRARFRDSFSSPKPFVPNEVTKVKFGINDVLHTFQRGHRIMVQVQSSWFPFVDRNPQTYVPNIFEAKDSDFIKATHKIYHTKVEVSALQVQILPAMDE